MKKYQRFLSENFQFLEVKFSVYLNRRVFVMGQELGSRKAILSLPVIYNLPFQGGTFIAVLFVKCSAVFQLLLLFF